jgi:hypothetical protein
MVVPDLIFDIVLFGVLLLALLLDNVFPFRRSCTARSRCWPLAWQLRRGAGE